MAYLWDDKAKKIIQEVADNYIVIFHNSSFDHAVLRKHGIKFNKYHDTMLMHYVLNPGRSHSLEFCGDSLSTPKMDKPWVGAYPTEVNDSLLEYCANDAYVTLKLFFDLKEKLEEDKEAAGLYSNIELPFSLVIQEMEETGLAIDVAEAQKFSNEVEKWKKEILVACKEMVGLVPGAVLSFKKMKPHDERPDLTFLREEVDESGKCSNFLFQSWVEFNPGSTKQSAYALQKLYNWKPTSQTPKGAWQVNQEVLEGLDYPLAVLLSEYSKLDTIIGTFLEPFIEHVTDNGVVHGNFNQCITLTGRLSSSKPNLQNIPRQGELGDRMRSLITVPNSDTKLIDGDLSNIEARVLAFYMLLICEDDSLAKLFINGENFHTSNSQAWDVSRDEAKKILFGKIYGQGVNSLAKQLRCSIQHAKKLVANIDSKCPALQELIDITINHARENGGVIHSLMGRRHVYPDLLSNNYVKRARAERQVFNALIQGSSADIMKFLGLMSLPMLSEYTAKMAANAHDEAIIYAPASGAEELSGNLTTLWSSSQLISPIPIQAVFHVGNTWKEAH